MLTKGQINVIPKENNCLGKCSWKELRVKVSCSLHSQPPNAAAAERRNAITSSKEYKTQGADTLILHGIPEPQLSTAFGCEQHSLIAENPK